MPGITPQGQLRTNRDDIPMTKDKQCTTGRQPRSGSTMGGIVQEVKLSQVTCQGHVTGGAKVTCAIPKTPGLVDSQDDNTTQTVTNHHHHRCQQDNVNGNDNDDTNTNNNDSNTDDNDSDTKSDTDNKTTR
ncbi:hypothetical protein EDB83DRAFT_2313778 [Lactarius deliciosus]|nr:hypothetical protein EDB83DRAFT_2313778 [Lactarius deliciosus]